MTKKPIFEFETLTETGVNETPVNRIVYIVETKDFYIMMNTTGLTASSTVDDAIQAENLVPIGALSDSLGANLWHDNNLFGGN